MMSAKLLQNSLFPCFEVTACDYGIIGSDVVFAKQGGAHDRVSVRQPASSIPADSASCRPHWGLRAGPHSVQRDWCHSYLRLLQPWLGSGRRGRVAGAMPNTHNFIWINGKVGTEMEQIILALHETWEMKNYFKAHRNVLLVVLELQSPIF